jgi:hypothetical protein
VGDANDFAASDGMAAAGTRSWILHAFVTQSNLLRLGSVIPAGFVDLPHG